MKNYFLTLFIVATTILNAQEAIIKGVVTTNDNIPVEGVSITYLTNGTTTNKKGKFQLTIPANQEITISFRHLSF